MNSKNELKNQTGLSSTTDDRPPGDREQLICAVVVSYFPTDDLVEVVRALQNQVSKILIVDNGSGAAANNVFSKLASSNVIVIRSPENLGIAAALNVGLQWARENKFNWLLTLDQDSVCEPDMVNCLYTFYRAQAENERCRIGILAPMHFDRDSGYIESRLRKDSVQLYEECNYVMTSGNLIPLALFADIGPYDEGFFIDYVDHDICLRAKKKGYRVLQINRARLGHRVGQMRQHTVAKRFSFFSYNYRPERHYYRYRNRVLLYKRHFGTWIKQDQGFALRELVKLYVVETDRWNKIKAMIAGTLDGIRGRTGRIDGVTFVSRLGLSSNWDRSVRGQVAATDEALAEPRQIVIDAFNGPMINGRPHSLFDVIVDPDRVFSLLYAEMAPNEKLVLDLPGKCHRLISVAQTNESNSMNAKVYSKDDLLRDLGRAGFVVNTEGAFRQSKLSIAAHRLASFFGIRKSEHIICSKPMNRAAAKSEGGMT